MSHDSQDLQIFSFISKDDDVFKCSVFKASNKVQLIQQAGKFYKNIFVMVVELSSQSCHKQ